MGEILGMKIIQLQHFRHFFKDEESYNSFIEMMKENTKEDQTLLMNGDDCIAILLSPSFIRTTLIQKALDTMGQNA